MLALDLRLLPRLLRGLQRRRPVRQVLHHHLGTLRLSRSRLPADQDGLLLLIDHHSVERLRICMNPFRVTAEFFLGLVALSPAVLLQHKSVTFPCALRCSIGMPCSIYSARPCDILQCPDHGQLLLFTVVLSQTARPLDDLYTFQGSLSITWPALTLTQQQSLVQT